MNASVKQSSDRDTNAGEAIAPGGTVIARSPQGDVAIQGRAADRAFLRNGNGGLSTGQPLHPWIVGSLLAMSRCGVVTSASSPQVAMRAMFAV
jgi:hypothetical protein